MKMYCIFARESIEKMGGNRGKLAAMAGHAFVGALLDAENGARTTQFVWIPPCRRQLQRTNDAP